MTSENYATGTRHLYYCLKRFTEQTLADSLVVVASPDVAGPAFETYVMADGSIVPTGQGWQPWPGWASNSNPLDDLWTDTNPGSAPAPFTTGTSPVQVTEPRTDGLHTQKLVRLDEAAGTLAHVVIKTLAKLFGRLRGVNSYRSFSMLGPVTHVFARNAFGSLRRLHAKQYSRMNRPQGPQLLYTRNWNGKEYFTRWGKPAIHRHRGRPAKTKAAIYAAYLATLKRRRKTNRRGPYDPGSHWNCPATKFPRPKREAIPLAKKQTGLLSHGSEQAREYAELAHEFLEKVFEEAGKELGQAAGDWFVDLVRQAFEQASVK